MWSWPESSPRFRLTRRLNSSTRSPSGEPEQLDRQSWTPRKRHPSLGYDEPRQIRDAERRSRWEYQTWLSWAISQRTRSCRCQIVGVYLQTLDPALRSSSGRSGVSTLWVCRSSFFSTLTHELLHPASGAEFASWALNHQRSHRFWLLSQTISLRSSIALACRRMDILSGSWLLSQHSR